MPDMGAWGPAIFSDDIASDIRADYRELLEDEVEDAEAERRIIAEYAYLGADEAHVLWLALAASEAALGRLSDMVKARAIEIIDGGIGLELWEEAGAKELKQRKAALAKLRDKLTAPPTARRRVHRPWFHITDLEPGDLLAYRAPDGRLALYRVARLDEHRVGTAPILLRLEWDKATLPTDRQIRNLKSRPEPKSRDARPASFRVAKHRKADPDWRDVGFTRIGNTAPTSDEQRRQARILSHWGGLQCALNADTYGG